MLYEVITFFERALRIDPDNSYALFGLGDVLRWQGDTEQAVHHWERLLQTAEGTIPMLTRLGDIYQQLGRNNFV